jgi:N-acetylneuraminate synthase
MENMVLKNGGDSMFIIAEIGINHNGDINIAKKLIDVAVVAGCNAVKFQKRTIDLVYSKEYLNQYRESPWGKTQREQKEGLEFGKNEYDEINRYCKEKGIEWFASAWDVESQKFLRQYNLKYNKIASAMLTNKPLLEEVASERKYTFISTGMSTMKEINEAVNIFKKYNCPFELMHCNSAYPTKEEDANLLMIKKLKEIYKCKVGYSGHEEGILISLYAAVLGATSIERHITLDKNMYGSDQSSSLEPHELIELVKKLKKIKKILGTGEKIITKDELKIRKKLRGE